MAACLAALTPAAAAALKHKPLFPKPDPEAVKPDPEALVLVQHISFGSGTVGDVASHLVPAHALSPDRAAFLLALNGQYAEDLDDAALIQLDSLLQSHPRMHTVCLQPGQSIVGLCQIFYS